MASPGFSDECGSGRGVPHRDGGSAGKHCRRLIGGGRRVDHTLLMAATSPTVEIRRKKPGCGRAGGCARPRGVERRSGAAAPICGRRTRLGRWIERTRTAFAAAKVRGTSASKGSSGAAHRERRPRGRREQPTASCVTRRRPGGCGGADRSEIARFRSRQCGRKGGGGSGITAAVAHRHRCERC
ncbi:putative proline-rich receptor-like protein kinase PERK3 [Iris pallida]|uniref:Proline-rich receptor-like protein kinase PERK3 n=1 Tax=Iris pallida TaxID=29817 RepID=A0AAX6EU37_IRIPA|nr:putative proline-rich receptor-like protein kinase PERK3 [Iris pallida]